MHRAALRGARRAMMDRAVHDDAVGRGVDVLAAVFDGHGPAGCGDACAAWLERNYAAAVSRALADGAAGAGEALVRAAAAAESRLLMLAATGGLRDGSTLCAVAVGAAEISCANVGDSRAVLSRAGGRAEPLSRDHRPYDAAEKARIRAGGGAVMSSRQRADPDWERCGECARLCQERAALARRAADLAAKRDAKADVRAGGRRRGRLARLLCGICGASGGASGRGASGGGAPETRTSTGSGSDSRSPRDGTDSTESLSPSHSRCTTPTPTPARSPPTPASRRLSGRATDAAPDGGPLPDAALSLCEAHAGAPRLWPGGLSVSRSLGDLPLKMAGCGATRGARAGPLVATAELRTVERRADDEFVIVATDGYWDVRSEADAVAEARSLLEGRGASAANVASMMARRAIDDGCGDNTTVVLVVLNF